jgi:hypothetical protein
MRLTLLLSLVSAMLVVAAPASAADITPTGTRINLIFPPQPATFAANTPFYVEHGFLCNVPAAPGPAGACQLGLYNFSLYVDGVLQPSTRTVSYQDGVISELWLMNFPNGLPKGDHTLLGIWTFRGGLLLTESVPITFS